MLLLCAIASGSNGNCYYIGNEREAVLVDAGISARQTIARLQQKNIDPTLIKAIFLSHEHSDHTCGARVLSKRLHVPVFVTSKTFMSMYAHLRPSAPKFFIPGTTIAIGSFKIASFIKNHDAVEPCSFTIEYNGHHVGVFTDIGSICDNVRQYLGMCHSLFLETNYDEKMLWEGRYPWPLKKRIASEHGHLSNDQAYELINNHGSIHLKTVFLSHLSAENNTPDLAMTRFTPLRHRYNFYITSRYAPGDVVRVDV